MRKPLVIGLVLVGGGALAAGIMLPSRNNARACEDARAANLPNAEEICARGSSGRSSWTHYSSTYWGGSGHTSNAVAAATAAAVAKSASSGFAGSGFASSGSASSGAVSSGAVSSGAVSSGSVSRGGFGGSGGSVSASSSGS